LPVQANHMQNKSLRHVSDTERFWWVFQRQKSNLQNGYKGRKCASVAMYHRLTESQPPGRSPKRASTKQESAIWRNKDENILNLDLG